ncbi:uridine kinase family protein [Cellulomonas rhizosphaerae]|uniref:Uridine kinase n=1 Tax=Cellulomonas rhizosphaerae TaxID=2293719 RepID=A0A413RQB4_9CELL|nr:uridine kinase [Cellulomonas rhizosphaerae]RHA44182.1 uridine kinase [Cellulomonas rhizosphaerae]
MTVADAVAAAALAVPARLGPVRLVVVDGPAGSGKTTFAASLAESAGALVLHLDDLYEGWSGLDGSLWPRLSAQVLEPLRRGLPGRYQRYDWGLGAFAEWVDVPVPRVLVIEGCGSGRRLVDPLAAVRVWVEAPDDLRLVRGLARDGDDARAHWEQWMRDERAHYARESTRERADVRLDALGRVVHGPALVDPDAPGVPGAAG